MKRALIAVSLLAAWQASAALPDWVQRAKSQAVPAQSPATAAVVLADETFLTVTPAGEMSTVYRRVVKILTPAGRDHAYGVAGFDKNTKLRGLRGWSIDPSGKVRTLKERHAVETTAGDFEVYTDAKMKFLDFPSEVGSVIAYEVEQHSQPYEPVSIWQFQESIPVLRARLEVKLPQGWTYEVKWRNHDPLEPAAGPMWELRDIPAIPDEPRMPSAASLAGRVGVQWISPSRGAKRTWSDVAKWYAGLAAPRLASTPEVQAKVRALTEVNEDPVRALARFTQLDVRYVAVEIGIGGYQPHAVSDIFKNRFGDCKDKATLLKSMLREKSVDTHYVLVHTTRGMVDPEFPTIASFNHVIAAIRIPKERAKGLHSVIEHPQLGTLLLFDPTSTTTPFGHLPPWLQASRGLLVTPDGGELIDLPAHAPEANELRRTAKLELEQSGTLKGAVEETRTGSIAARMRSELQALNAVERVRYIESTLAYHFASQTAAGVEIENLDEPEANLIVRYNVSAPNYAKGVAGMVLIRPRVIGSKAEGAVALAERKHGYVTDGPSVHTDEVEIAMPPSFNLDELPKPLSLATPDVQYASNSTFENGVLRYKRRYAMKSFNVDLGAIPSLNDAFAKISADERASAVFK